GTSLRGHEKTLNRAQVWLFLSGQWGCDSRTLPRPAPAAVAAPNELPSWQCQEGSARRASRIDAAPWIHQPRSRASTSPLVAEHDECYERRAKNRNNSEPDGAAHHRPSSRSAPRWRGTSARVSC